MYDVAVIGSRGYTAALEAKRRGMEAVLFEGMPSFGHPPKPGLHPHKGAAYVR